MGIRDRVSQMIKLSILCAMCISLSVVSCGIISDEPDTGTSISGITITGSNTTAALKKMAYAQQNIVPNVAVYLYKKGYESIIEDSTVSNTLGEFTFLNHPLGEYIVMADSTRIKGGIKRNVVIGENNRRIDTLEVAIEKYVDKSVNLQGKSVLSMKYFHFNVESVYGIFTFAALNNHAQFVSVVQMISGEPIEIQYTIINVVANLYVTLSGTTIVELSSSSINQGLSSQVGVLSSVGISSVQSSEGTVPVVSSSPEVGGVLSSSSTLGQTTPLSSNALSSDVSIPISSSILSSSSDASSSSETPLSSTVSSSSISSSSSGVSSSAELSGLIAHWKFENNLSNEVSSIENGVDSGGVSFVTGVVGDALFLDGIDDGVSFPNSVGTFDLQEFTFMGWAQFKSFNEYKTIWENASSLQGSGSGTGFVLHPDGKLYLTCWDGTGWVFAGTPAGLITDQWYHISGTRGVNELNLYINGALVATTAMPNSVMYSSMIPRFGEDHTGNSNGTRALDGYVDEFKIFNRALSDAEILSEYSLINP